MNAAPADRRAVQQKQSKIIMIIMSAPAVIIIIIRLTIIITIRLIIIIGADHRAVPAGQVGLPPAGLRRAGLPRRRVGPDGDAN